MRSAARSTSGSQSLHAVIDLVCHSSKNSPRSSLACAGTQPSECEMKCTHCSSAGNSLRYSSRLSATGSTMGRGIPRIEQLRGRRADAAARPGAPASMAAATPPAAAASAIGVGVGVGCDVVVGVGFGVGVGVGSLGCGVARRRRRRRLSASAAASAVGGSASAVGVGVGCRASASASACARRRAASVSAARGPAADARARLEVLGHRLVEHGVALAAARGSLPT